MLEIFVENFLVQGIQTLSGDPVSTFINANDLIWDFFQQYSLDCDPQTVIESDIENIKVKLYPNPTSGVVKIYSEMNYSEINVSVYNLLGEKIYENTPQKEFDLTPFPEGTYIVLLRIEDTIDTRKVIKLE